MSTSYVRIYGTCRGIFFSDYSFLLPVKCFPMKDICVIVRKYTHGRLIKVKSVHLFDLTGSTIFLYIQESPRKIPLRPTCNFRKDEQIKQNLEIINVLYLLRAKNRSLSK